MDTASQFAYSIIIPTYNRLEILPEVLDALEGQEGAPPFEAIVVDDGSSDGTGAFLAERQESASAVPLTVLCQENQGPATARNRGVATARGERVAFLGDDTVPANDWLAMHARAAASRPGIESLAVIGYTAWHPRMRLNPFLRYINEFGLQFGYSIIENPEDVPFNFFYTSNVSLPRRLLVEEPFDLRFPYAAWEDTELSYRLKNRHGLHLVYEPTARVAHDHPTTIQRFCQRQEKAGYSGVVFALLHPELGGFVGVGEGGPPPLPPAGKQRWRERLAFALQSWPVHMPKVWEELLRYHYIRGLRRGWEDRAQLAREPEKG